MFFKRLLTALLPVVATLPIAAQTSFYVSPSGDDRGDGSREQPKQSLACALQSARELRRTTNCYQIEIVLLGDTDLYESLFVRPEDSGTPAHPLVIRSESGSRYTIGGGVEVTGWKRGRKGVWSAPLPRFNGRVLEFRQLYVDGRKADRARDVDDFEQMNRILGVDNDNSVLWVPASAVASIADDPASAELVLHQMWCVSFLRIRSIEIRGDSAAVSFFDPESHIQFTRPWPRPMVAEGRMSPFYLTAHKSLMDRAGEWSIDPVNQTVSYIPLPDQDMNSVRVVVPAVETVVAVEGTADRMVHDVEFRDLGFAFSTWLRPSFCGHVPLQATMYLTDGYRISPKMERSDSNHRLDNQGWLGRPSAGVVVDYGRNIAFRGCEFYNMGSSAIDFREGTKGGSVERSEVRECAGNGIVTGSFSPSAFETHLVYNPADQRCVCDSLRLVDNTITSIGTEDWGAVAVAAGCVSNITIEHNTIFEVPYTGISVGWGWNCSQGCMHSNRVAANHIYRYATRMYDTAGVYTLGNQRGSVIEYNCVEQIGTPSYVHDPNHWFYLYTDEGSSGITVRNNWTEGEKFLQNANGPDNLWSNNGPFVADSIRQSAGVRTCSSDR